MNLLGAPGVPVAPGVGDVVRDVQGMYALVRAQDQAGGIGGYLAQVYREFSDVPAQVRRIQAQLDRVKAVFQEAKADTTPLMDAQRDLATTISLYPAAQDRVRRLMDEIGPIMPQLQSGDLAPETVAQLALQGVDVVGTFQSVQDVFRTRDAAESKIAQATRSPSLTPETARDAAAALAGATLGVPSTVMYVGLVAVAGWMLFDLFKRRSPA